MSRQPTSSLQMASLPVMKNYRLTEKLGSGTFATVYKAYEKGNRDKIVAVKCILISKLTKVSRANLFTEIKVMKDLKHENIVRLLDFEWDDKYIFLIMEYCNGGDLSSFIRSKRKLKEKEARKFLRQLALALQFLHKKEIAHMDLKPQNLLLKGYDKPVLKLADFGMAQHLRSGDSSESFRGSPLYMAPEIMLGHPYDSKTLFGMAPFASTTFEELEEKVLDESPVQIPTDTNLSHECRDMLVRLLERDQTKRISFEDFFSHPFIDLEHVPGPDSLGKARELVTRAVADDTKGNLKSALSHYMQAVEYFIPAIEFEQDPSTKDSLRTKVEQYIERAEHLKEIISRRRPSLHQTKYTKQQLEQVKAKNPYIKTALMKASMAEQEEAGRNFKRAFELYKESVELLMSVAEESSSPVEKGVIKAEVKLFLDRAEEVQLLSKQKQKIRLFSHFTNSGHGQESSDSRCRVQ